jgi:hypothetical protein
MKRTTRLFNIFLTLSIVLALGANFRSSIAQPNIPPALPQGGDALWKRNLALGPNEWVYATAVAPNGDVYIGGDFTAIGGLQTGLVARWGAADQQWHTLGKSITWGRIYSLAISGDYLYVGGYFDAASGEDIATNGIARWNMTTNTWSNVGGPGMLKTSGSPDVYALAVDGSGNVYAGGDFTSVNGISAQNVAEWNGSTWSAIGSLGSTSEKVYSLVWHAPFLIAGGNFAGLHSIAAWNGVSWSTLGGGVGGTYHEVLAMTADSNYLYAGGSFESVINSDSSTIAVNYIARWSWASATWSDVGGGLDGPDVDALTVGPDGKIYVGGRFHKYGDTIANNLARWNGTAWEGVYAGFVEGVNSNVYTLAFSGRDLWVGGAFQLNGALSGNFVSKWNLDDQQWHTPGGNTPNGAVHAILVDYPNVYYGGNFTYAGGIQTSGVARYNVTTNTWSALGTGLSGCANFLCNGPSVSALALHANSLYVGGDFTNAGGTTVHGLARIDLGSNTWYDVGGGVTCTGLFCAALVDVLYFSGDTLFVGGQFLKAGSTTVNNIAAWYAGSWSTFYDANTGLTGTNGRVNALDIHPTTMNLYVGGNFTSPATNISRWDGAHWYGVGTGTLNGAVNAIDYVGSNLYIGGNFTGAGGSANYLARLSGSVWVAVGGSVDGPVHALADNGSELVVGGDFVNAGTISANRVVRWTGSKWIPLGSGMSGLYGITPTVNAIAVNGKYVYLGGYFRKAGPNLSDHIAIWGGYPTYVPLTKR